MYPTENQPSGADVAFFRNIGIALVLLVALTGSISVVGVLNATDPALGLDVAGAYATIPDKAPGGAMATATLNPTM